MTDTNSRQKTLTTTERDFVLALSKIYQVYGPDLDAFFSDVEKRLNLARSDNDRSGSQGDLCRSTKQG